jgi:hypothetical protein
MGWGWPAWLAGSVGKQGKRTEWTRAAAHTCGIRSRACCNWLPGKGADGVRMTTTWARDRSNTRLSLQTTNQSTSRFGIFGPSFIEAWAGLELACGTTPEATFTIGRVVKLIKSSRSRSILECRESNVHSSCSLGAGKTKVRRVSTLHLQHARVLVSLIHATVSLHLAFNPRQG